MYHRKECGSGEAEVLVGQGHELRNAGSLCTPAKDQAPPLQNLPKEPTLILAQ